MINRMTATIIFDREIDGHYISPGGYEVVDRDGNTVQFDFETYYGFIDKENRKALHIDVRGLDLDSFPKAVTLSSVINNIDLFTEIFVYTGEDNDPEINVVGIKDVRFYSDNDEEICISDKSFEYCKYE